MKKNIILIMLILFIIFPVISKENIAILNFKPINVKREIALAVTENLITAIAEYKKYKIIERTQIDQAFHELKLSGTDDFEDDTAIEVGKMAKARYLLIGNVTKIGSKYTINARGIEIETGVVFFAESINVNSEDKLVDAIKLLAMAICDSENYAKINKNLIDLKIPEYIFIDNFDTYNQKLWVKESINDEITVESSDGKLVFSGNHRKGRLNSINTIKTKEIRPTSFAVEIKFRDPLESAQALQLFAGNKDWRFGNSLSLVCNFKKEYYKFAWAFGTQWHSNPDNIMYTFGDEGKKFHTLKLVFDMENNIAYGFVDDKLVDKVSDFKFVKSEKMYMSITLYESVSGTGKNVKVELDDFKCSVDLTK